MMIRFLEIISCAHLFQSEVIGDIDLEMRFGYWYRHAIIFTGLYHEGLTGHPSPATWRRKSAANNMGLCCRCYSLISAVKLTEVHTRTFEQLACVHRLGLIGHLNFDLFGIMHDSVKVTHFDLLGHHLEDIGCHHGLGVSWRLIH